MKKLFVLILLFSISITAQNKRAMTFDDLWSMKRIGTVTLSADGKTIAFNSTIFNYDENKGNSDIYLMNSDGSNLRVFKNSEKNESSPSFSPVGNKVAYTLSGQIWISDIDGSNPIQLTNLSGGASGISWSPDGSKILFVSDVYPECATDDCNKQKDEAKEKSKVKASIFTELMYRHWDGWRGEKRSHLFMVDVASKEAVDLTLFSKFDVPPISLGSAKDYSFSPDGKEIAFVMNTDEFLATSTNNDIFLINVNEIKKGEKTPFTRLTENKGNDNQPVYSPDGRYIAFTSMAREGFEADKQRVMLFDRVKKNFKDLTTNFDRSAYELVWSPDSKTIYFNADNEVHQSVYKLDITTQKIETLLKEYSSSGLLVSNSNKLYFKQQRTTLPFEIFSLNPDGSNLTQLSFVNKDLLAQLEMNPMETFWAKGAGGTPVQSMIVKPPFFDPNKKYPMIFLIHGGPQSNWADDFHYRWNQQKFASKGYVVVSPNPRGSTGYGQKFTDEISGDWAGKVYVDLMNTYDYAIKNFSFIDPKNTFAAGASYGGYMINWIAGNNQKFNALVSHAGVFNLESMYGTTEELWFVEWEFKGTPWQNRKLYEKFSPHRHIHKAKTPVLITHGAFDFRVSEEQAFQLFTSLQRLNVPSKFLYFPDETHFIQKPQNARLWWTTVFDWYEQWKKK